MPAKNVNDTARRLDERGAHEFFASKLAPTHLIRSHHELAEPCRTDQPDGDTPQGAPGTPCHQRTAFYRHTHRWRVGSPGIAGSTGQRFAPGHPGRVLLPRRFQPERPASTSAPFGPALRDRRPAPGTDRRRADERPHHPRRHERTVRLWPPGQRDPGVPAGPGCRRTADQPGRRRRDPVACPPAAGKIVRSHAARTRTASKESPR